MSRRCGMAFAVALALWAAPGEASEITVQPLPEVDSEAQEVAPLPPGSATEFAVLRGLDKVTGRAETFDVPIGGEVDYGRLFVRVMACDQTALDEPLESAAFLQIRDPARAKDAEMVFSGWMFASSPELSAMDHVRYDIWVLSCRIF